MWSDAEKQTARYTVEIVKMPGGLMERSSAGDIHYALQNCFMEDIEVHWVHTTKAGKWACHLAVKCPPADSAPIPAPEPGISLLHSENGDGGGGGGEVDLMWLMKDDGTFCTSCGRVFDETDSSTYVNVSGKSCCQACFWTQTEEMVDDLDDLDDVAQSLLFD
jgi:hypothetical protein